MALTTAVAPSTRRSDRIRKAKIGLHGLDLSHAADRLQESSEIGSPHGHPDAPALVDQRPHDIASEESRPAEYRRQAVGFPGGFGHRGPLNRRPACLGEGRRVCIPGNDVKSLGVRLLTRGDDQIGGAPRKLSQMIEFGLERADARGRRAQFDNEIADFSLRDQRSQRLPARPAVPRFEAKNLTAPRADQRARPRERVGRHIDGHQRGSARAASDAL